MAVPTFPDWSLGSFNYTRTTGQKQKQKPNSFNSCTCSSTNSSTSNKSFSFLSLPCRNLRIFRPHSTSCPSPTFTLQDEQEEDATTTISSPNAKSPFLDQLDPKRQQFRRFIEPVPRDLNGFISALLEDPQTAEVGYKYYEKVKQKPEFVLKKSTLKHLIRYLVRTKNWNSILSLCDHLKASHTFPDSYTCSRLIRSCIRARKFKLVHSLLEVFKNDQGIAVLALRSAMKGYNKLHMYRSTIDVYSLMKSAGVPLDPGCYSLQMEAYMKTANVDRVLAVFQELQQYCSNNNIVESSKPLFYTKIYRILCESLGKSGRPFEALEYYKDIINKGISEDPSFYSVLISSFASVGEVEIAEELFKEAESKKMMSRDPEVFLKLVLMYIEAGMPEKTMDVVTAMKRAKLRVPDCIFCAIVNGFSKRRGYKAALEIYQDMIHEGCEPGQVTYASVMNVYYRLGLYSEAERVFSEMEKRGFDKCVVAYSNMVAIYGKSGKPREAMRLVAKMKERGCEPNVWIYNSLLDMHGRAINLRQVEKIWKEMKRRKIVADKVSYTSVISAYNKARELENCIKYYQDYRMNGGRIDRAMGGIMVGVFSKMSRIEELMKLLQDMKTEGTQLDGRLYHSALIALRDAGLAASASKMVAPDQLQAYYQKLIN
ncbi:hypothetical protein NMG60_11024226 [Bertholletia excelsa]